MKDILHKIFRRCTWDCIQPQTPFACKRPPPDSDHTNCNLPPLSPFWTLKPHWLGEYWKPVSTKRVLVSRGFWTSKLIPTPFHCLGPHYVSYWNSSLQWIFHHSSPSSRACLGNQPTEERYFVFGLQSLCLTSVPGFAGTNFDSQCRLTQPPCKGYLVGSWRII